MNKEEREILINILELMIKRQQELQKQIKLLNTKINILKNRQCKGCCKGCGKCSK